MEVESGSWRSTEYERFIDYIGWNWEGFVWFIKFLIELGFCVFGIVNFCCFKEFFVVWGCVKIVNDKDL